MARVFGKMESIGPHSDAEFEREKSEFLRRPDALALLKEAYSEASGGRTRRWKAVFLLSQMRASEAVEILAEVALSKDSDFPDLVVNDDSSSAGRDHDDPGPTDLPARITAAFGISQSVAAGVPGATNALRDVLTKAETEVARMAAVEVFANGHLTDAHRAILKERGIFSEFRRHTEAEANDLRRIDPADLPRRDGKRPEHGEPPAATE